MVGSGREVITATGSSGVFVATGPAAVYSSETPAGDRTPAVTANSRYPSFRPYPPLRPPVGHSGTPRKVDRRLISLPSVVSKAENVSSECAANDDEHRAPATECARAQALSGHQQTSESPRFQTYAKLNVSWSSAEPSPRAVGVRRRYFFTHRGFDDERGSHFPGHFDVLLDDSSRTTSRTDHLRCSYVDYLSVPGSEIGHDADAAAALTEQMNSNAAKRTSHLDVELAAQWLQSIRPRTRYDAAPMLTLAKSLLQAMCTSSIEHVVGSVEKDRAAYRKYTAQLHKQNLVLQAARAQLEACAASAAQQNVKIAQLEEELRNSTHRYQKAQAAAAAQQRNYAAEIENLQMQLQSLSQNFNLVQNGVAQGRDVVAGRNQADDRASNNASHNSSEDPTAGTADDAICGNQPHRANTSPPGSNGGANNHSQPYHTGGETPGGSAGDAISEGGTSGGSQLHHTGVEPPGGSVGDAISEGISGGNSAYAYREADAQVDTSCTRTQSPDAGCEGGHLREAFDLKLAREDSRFKDASVATDDAWGQLTRSLETARSEVVSLEAVKADLVTAQARKHKMALAMVRATMTATFARAAKESAEGAGEVDAAQAQVLDMTAQLHEAQNQLLELTKQNTEISEQMDELFDMYNNLRKQKSLELEALEVELQRLGLTLELPPPEKPKLGSWTGNKISTTPYHVLLSGEFTIKLK